jgi:HSP20 family protein
VNIGSTDDSAEIVAFAPGVNAAALDISIDEAPPTISGERKPAQTEQVDELRSYAQECFVGTFRRVIELPGTADPDKVQARYSNGACRSASASAKRPSRAPSRSNEP